MISNSINMNIIPVTRAGPPQVHQPRLTASAASAVLLAHVPSVVGARSGMSRPSSSFIHSATSDESTEQQMFNSVSFCEDNNVDILVGGTWSRIGQFPDLSTRKENQKIEKVLDW